MAVRDVTSEISARLAYATGATTAFDSTKRDTVSCVREASNANAVTTILCRASEALNWVMTGFPAPTLSKDGATAAAILDPSGVPSIMSRFLQLLIEVVPEDGDTGTGVAFVQIADMGAAAAAHTMVAGDAEISHKYAAIPLLSTSRIEVDFTEGANLAVRLTVVGFQGLTEVGGGYSY